MAFNVDLHSQNSILRLDKAILNTDEIINKQILAIQAKIQILQTSRAQFV